MSSCRSVKDGKVMKVKEAAQLRLVRELSASVSSPAFETTMRWARWVLVMVSIEMVSIEMVSIETVSPHSPRQRAQGQSGKCWLQQRTLAALSWWFVSRAGRPVAMMSLKR